MDLRGWDMIIFGHDQIGAIAAGFVLRPAIAGTIKMVSIELP